MISSLARVTEFIDDEEGATALEYGLIASLIVLVIVGSVSLVAERTTDMWTQVSVHI